MAQNFKKLVDGINIVPKTTSTANSAGDIDYDSTANKLNLHNGTISSPLVTEAGTATLTNKTISGASNTITNVSLTTGVTGILPIANGGTNAVTNSAAFDNLSPMTTGGDLIYGGASGTGTRLPNGSNGQVLTSSGGTAAPTWTTPSPGFVNPMTTLGDIIIAGASGVANRLGIGSSTQVLTVVGGSPAWAAASGGTSTIGTINSQTKSADGAVISGSSLVMQTADATFPGLISTGAQTIAGAKTFSGAISASNLSGTNSGDITLTAVGASPSADGATLSGQALTLQPADATHPGLVTTSAQTIAGEKTLDNALVLTQISTPSTPAANHNKFYVKTDGNFYTLDSSGTEVPLNPGMTGTDFVSYTPTIVGFGTPSNVDFRWAKVGQNIHIIGGFTSGTPTAVTAEISLPGSLVSDSGIVTNQVVGDYVIDTAAPGAFYTIISPSSANMNLSYSNQASLGGYTPITADLISSNGSNITISAVFPITGWTANNGPGRSGFQLFASSQVTTASSVVSSAGYTTFSNSPAFTFTPIVSGTYKVYANALINNGSNAAQSEVRIDNTSGGATLLYDNHANVYSSYGNISCTSPVMAMYSLTAGVNYVFDLQGKCSGGSLYLDGTLAPFYMFAELCG